MFQKTFPNQKRDAGHPDEFANRSLINYFTWILKEQSVYGVVKFDWLSIFTLGQSALMNANANCLGLPLYYYHGQGHNWEVDYKRQESNIDRSLSGVQLVGCLSAHHYCIASVGLVPAPLNFLPMVPSARLLCLDTHPTVLRPLTRFYSFIALRNIHITVLTETSTFLSIRFQSSWRECQHSPSPIQLEVFKQTTVQLGRWSVHNIQ